MSADCVLDRITPIILTYNEEANIGRTLEALRWASRVVVLDSGSTDSTSTICAGFLNVDWRVREFDDHANQSNFALDHYLNDAGWVMFLDSDYLITHELHNELQLLMPSDFIDGYRIRFCYCIEGQPLRGTLYPPKIVLFRRGKGRFYQEGHAHFLKLCGNSESMRGAILHDDRKPMSVFVASQRKYARMEAHYLFGQRMTLLSWPERIRRLIVVAPWLVPLYVLLVKGIILDGRPGLIYVWQRFLAEVFIARELVRCSIFRKRE